jgi:predicted DNA-binding transcriptional regulator YafY
MKKTERIYEMLYFLNDKQSFQLYDLMKKFDISKSTALRDIETMEEMGMPIYSKFGRNGCYEILKNRLLSPIHFQLEELQALYFSMLSLKAYENSPFQLSMEQLQQKFQRCLSPSILSQFQKMEQVFQLDKKDQNQNCIFLPDIIRLAMEEVPCFVQYTKNDEQQLYRVQFFQILASFGQWYGLGYMFEKKKLKFFD